MRGNYTPVTAFRAKFRRRWDNLRRRCNDKNAVGFHNYGGRGIKCLWKNWQEFHKDMYPSYCEHAAIYGEENTQIERMDNNGHYERSNCRWATRLEQAANKSTPLRELTCHGKKGTIRYWSEKLNLDPKLLANRMFAGWDDEKVIHTPPNRLRWLTPEEKLLFEKLLKEGKTYHQISKITNRSWGTIQHYHNKLKGAR